MILNASKKIKLDAYFKKQFLDLNRQQFYFFNKLTCLYHFYCDKYKMEQQLRRISIYLTAENDSFDTSLTAFIFAIFCNNFSL